MRKILYLTITAGWLIGFFGGIEQVSAQRQAVLDLLSKHEKTTFSIHFCEAETGRTVLDYQSRTPLIPASNMKLITTATALNVLGGDFVYKTVVGMLDGNLVIIGGGDPLIGDPIIAEEKSQDISYIFEQIQAALQKRQISRIAGDLLIDDFLFDDQRYHPSWAPREANKDYAAQVSALNFFNNCVEFTLIPARRAGQAVRYTLIPDTSYVSVTNKCTTTLNGAQTAWASRERGTNQITLRGRTKYEHVLPVALERPSAFFGHVLAEHLLAHQMKITGKLRIVGLCDARRQPLREVQVLYVHQTPLAEVLARANRDSQNMVAECLLKTAGAYHRLNSGVTPAQGSWPTGQEAAVAYLSKLGVSSSQFTIDDGSGLSRNNRVSARCLTRILQDMHRHEHAGIFQASLATPNDGTLKRNNRFQESRYQQRICAKSGYISQTWALSGYARRADGTWLAFAILANKGTSSPRANIDQIVKLMIE